MRKQYSRQRGLTLIEIMIALVIGVLLLLGTTTMFITNKRIYREQEAMGLLQENARFATQILYDDIRMAGYVGCSDDSGLVDDQTGTAGLTNPIEGYEEGITANWLPSNTAVGIAPKAGTDAIIVRHLNGSNIFLTNDLAEGSTDDIVTTDSINFNDGDTVAVHDCAGTVLVSIDTVNNPVPNDGVQTLVQSTAWPRSFDVAITNPRISRISGQTYYIAVYDHDNDGTADMPALFNSDLGGQALIDGVEDMQVLYGEDTDSDLIADEFRTAANVANWTNVKSVQYALLIRTLKPDKDIEPNPITYYLHGVAYGPFNDKFRRRVVTTTVLLRNNQ